MSKERELNAFLDAFPQRKAAKQDELTAKSEAITSVLEKLNRLHAAVTSALPSQGEFQQMKVSMCKDLTRKFTVQHHVC